jgi:integrase
LLSFLGRTQGFARGRETNRARVLICLYETAMRPAEPLALTWPKVDLKTGVIRLAAEDVKEAEKRVIPISPTLRAVLEELREEQRRVASIGGEVFTRNGRPIRNYRTAFEEAREKPRLKDITPHDYRHTAITRWLLAGIPQEVVMKGSGHKDLSVHYRYVNLREEHVRAVFHQHFPTPCTHGIDSQTERLLSA